MDDYIQNSCYTWVERKTFPISEFLRPISAFTKEEYEDAVCCIRVGQYCIRDISGQIIKEIRPLMPDIHYVIHTNDFISGTYIILFLKDGHLVKSEKFIISH